MNESNNELQNEDLEFNYGGETIKISCHAEVPEREKVNLKQIIPQLIKSKGGLYPHEILMLNVVSKYKSNCKNYFQWYWEKNLGVEEPQALIDKLVSQGFVDVEDTKTTISRLTIPEIKEFLKEYGCKLSGNKPELLNRLFAECDIPVIGSKLTQRRYCLTDKGKEEVEREENEYVMFTFENGNGISIFEMNMMLYKNNPLNLSYKDIIWRKYVKQAEEALQNSRFGSYSHTKWYMSKFLKVEGRYEESLYYLCEAAVYDLTGLTCYNGIYEDSLSKLEWMIEQSFPYNARSGFTITPAIVVDIRCMQTDIESIGLNFREQIIKNLKEIKIDKEVFSTEEKIKIFFAELDKDYDKLKEIYSKLEKIIKGKYNKLMEETIRYFVECEKNDDAIYIHRLNNLIFLKIKLEKYGEEEYDEESIKMLAENLLFIDEDTAEEDIERITELLKSIVFTEEDDYEEDDYEEDDYEDENYDDDKYQENNKWMLESNQDTFFEFDRYIIEDEINKIDTLESDWLVLEPSESIKGTIYIQVCIEVIEGNYRREGENFHIELCFEDDKENLTSFRKDNLTKAEVLKIFIDYFENNNLPDIKDWYSVEL